MIVMSGWMKWEWKNYMKLAQLRPKTFEAQWTNEFFARPLLEDFHIKLGTSCWLRSRCVPLRKHGMLLSPFRSSYFTHSSTLCPRPHPLVQPPLFPIAHQLLLHRPLTSSPSWDGITAHFCPSVIRPHICPNVRLVGRRKRRHSSPRLCCF